MVSRVCRRLMFSQHTKIRNQKSIKFTIKLFFWHLLFNVTLLVKFLVYSPTMLHTWLHVGSWKWRSETCHFAWKKKLLSQKKKKNNKKILCFYFVSMNLENRFGGVLNTFWNRMYGYFNVTHCILVFTSCCDFLT